MLLTTAVHAAGRACTARHAARLGSAPTHSSHFGVARALALLCREMSASTAATSTAPPLTAINGAAGVPRETHSARAERLAALAANAGPVRSFMLQNYHHFNAASTVDAAAGYVDLIDNGGKMFLTLVRSKCPQWVGMLRALALGTAQMLGRDRREHDGLATCRRLAWGRPLFWCCCCCSVLVLQLLLFLSQLIIRVPPVARVLVCRLEP
jgi:hypothetical protein